MTAAEQDKNYAIVDNAGFLHGVDKRYLAEEKIAAGLNRVVPGIIETDVPFIGGYPMYFIGSVQMLALINVDNKTVKVTASGDGEGWRDLHVAQDEKIPDEIMALAKLAGF